MKRLALLTLLSFSALTPAYAVDERYPVYEPRPALAGAAAVSGSPAPASLLLLWPESFRMIEPGVTLRIGGESNGGVRIRAAVEAVSILVHEKNPLSCIRLAALKRLYTEENPTWDMVGDMAGNMAGGAPLAVRPLVRAAKPGESDFFMEKVLAGAPASARVEPIARYSALLARIAETPEAIGYAPAGYRGDGVKALKVSDGGDCAPPSASASYRAEYPLARFVLLEGERNEAGLAFFDYVLSRAGQRDAVIAGFYSLPWIFAAEERKKLGLD